MLTTMFAGMALLTLLLAVPLAAEKVPPNRVYGFRTPRTLKDERVWYPTNRVTGRNGIVLAMALGLASVLSFLGMLGGWGIAALVAFSIFGLISTIVSASRIVNQVDKGGPLIDYRSSFEKRRQEDPSKQREKLLEKLRKE